MAGKVSDSPDCLGCSTPLVRPWLTDYCGDDCRPRCDAPDCARPRSGSGNLYCRTHMSSIYKHGRLPETTWAKGRRCVVCGATDWPETGMRKHCSGKCQQLTFRNKGDVPAVASCVRCGTDIDLFVASSKSGRKRRADTLMCRHCRAAKHLRHGVSVMELFNRDGGDCTICGAPIDLDLRHPDLMSATVDHVIPYAKGGAHDISNLALAHLTCNVTKQAREGWTPVKA